ncbi:hypothetical protein L9F63_017604, partial [Diploptera punctata]
DYRPVQCWPKRWIMAKAPIRRSFKLIKNHGIGYFQQPTYRVCTGSFRRHYIITLALQCSYSDNRVT